MILISGGTGLIGGHLLLLLSKASEPIRAIYRSQSRVENVKSLFKDQGNPNFDNIQWVKADLLDVPSLETAFEGVTKVYHCAGLISFDPDAYRELRKVNIDGTANLVNLCIANKIQKLAYISSIAVFGDHATHKQIDETSYWNPEAENNVYAIAKYGAEMEIWRATQEEIPVVIVNPGIVLGEGFEDSPSSAIFNRIAKGLSYYPPGSSGFVDVKDVSRAIHLLMESPIFNERYILVGALLKYKTVLNLIAENLNRTRPSRELNRWQLQLLWRLDAVATFLFRKKRILSRHSAQSLWNSSQYSSDKIIKELDFEFTDISTTVRRICNTIKLDKSKA
ncbi:NAD-dependent epimerase/dehydratase [Galbibacter marinus]|uniref:NAD-dependent epimerase/dehydratase n=1 Tax=Galbibacter marinus TaxID=555500 RepID=K2Q6X8_9FLAO|nr:NAD-dependent epimerase/dehydratase family protein [Galbibacter marinus]EKF56636.1 NAD-dependent epimerase/dehydratase [Galbibacter marinus]